MASPRLSIVVPTYNRAHMLPRMLASTQCISSDCEILVIDNASTDDTPGIVATYSAQDRRIRYIRNVTNIGVIANFNMAMGSAQGEYVCCLGDDDATLPGNFERKLALLDRNPDIGLVYSQWRRVDENGRDLGTCIWPGLLQHSYIGGRSEFQDLLPACYIMLQSVVFRKDLFAVHGGFDEGPTIPAGHDWDMLLRWAFHAQTAYIAEPMVSVGIHAQSHTESVSRSKGHFAEGRIAIWRKWLVDGDRPPVLDESRWQRMRDAFVPDLQYEFAGDHATIDRYLSQLAEVRRLSETGAAQRFRRLTGESSTPATDQPVKALPLVWHAPVRDPSGYADEARHFLYALDANAAPVAARELRWNDRVVPLAPDRQRTLARLLQAPAERESVHVWHILAPHFERDGSAVANVGRTMFETDRLPAGWAEACGRMDAVWVPGEFNRETFARAGVPAEKLRVVPGAIDVSPFHRGVTPMRINGARGYNFLSIFDWSLRKGWDVLIRAFVDEFRSGEDVALLFKIHSSYGLSMEKIVRRVEEFLIDSLGRDPNRIPDIVFQDTNVSDTNMPSLYRAADCYVMPTRGEGWGRPFMEAMALGMPTIGTGWSGQTEFMNAGNSLLIDYEVVDVPEAGWTEIPTYRGHRWAEPSVTHLRQLMRRAFEDREHGARLGEQARHDISERFSYARVAAIIADEVERLR